MYNTVCVCVFVKNTTASSAHIKGGVQAIAAVHCCAQAKLEPAYKSELASYGVTFSSLIALNNMPIKRFADWLQVMRGVGGKGRKGVGWMLVTYGC